MTFDGKERRSISDYMTAEDCEKVRQSCPIALKVLGEHGLENEHEDVKTAIRALENRLTRIEVLIPFVTVALMKLLDFLLARVTMAAVR